jgi:uncharacterized membrane protein YbaN (DUF454 family)
MMVKALRKPLFLGTGWLCVGLGMLGIAMPLFPTTPFLLVAVWAFSKSSPEMAEKLRNHRIAGRFIRDWQDEGVVPVGAKIAAVAMLAAMLAYLRFWSEAPGWVVLAAAAIMLGVAGLILSRPSSRRAG